MDEKIEGPTKGARHHVMNRGVRLHDIFFADESCAVFLELVGEAVERCAIRVHGYALTPNHFHLMVESVRGNLSEAMKLISSRSMVSPLFSKLMGQTTREMKESGLEDTFFMEYAFQKRPCRATTMTCTQCGMITFMEKNNLQELKRICNAFDFAQAKAFGLGLRQPTRIGQGDDTCQYIFTTDRNDTVLPPNMEAILNAPMEG